MAYASHPGLRRPGPSLRVKLAAVLLCLLAAAAAVIVTAAASALRGQLTRQAGAQLRVYAYQLTSHPFQVLGTARGAPVAAVPFDGTGTGGGARAPGTAGTVGSPGAARMAGESAGAVSAGEPGAPGAVGAAGAAGAAGGPGAVGAAGAAGGPGAVGAAGAAGTPGAAVAGIDGIGAFSIELRGPGGQLLLSAGPGSRPGQPVPAPFARVPARTGVLRTVRAAGGDYLVLAEPVHVQARRLAFGYGADDFVVTGEGRTSGARTSGASPAGARTGSAGTLVVGLRLAGIGNQVRRLTLLAVAVSAAAILVAGGLAWAAIRFSLRPVTRAAQAADRVAASDPPARVPQSWPGGGLAGSLHSTLNHLGARFTASAEAEEAARAATEGMARRLESAAQALRRPISLLHGAADRWANAGWPKSGDPDRALAQIDNHAAAAEAALNEAALDQGGDAPFTDPVRQNPDKPGSDRTGPVRSR